MAKQSKNILIPNPKRLAKLKSAFAQAGAKKIHVLADFDKTLTKAFVNGKKIPSLISVLRDEKYLTPNYAEKAYALYHKYHQMENNPRLSMAKKKRAMHDWWTAHFKLLIKSGLNKKDIARAVKSKNIQLRTNGAKFFKLLKYHKIPLVIMSASGLGNESIDLYLKKIKNYSGNIQIISNSFIWDQNGRAIGFNKPIIHSANKDEVEIKNFSKIMETIKHKKNVLLLGDQLSDLDMITGFKYDHLIKIGFYNYKQKNNLAQFKKKYDIIILGDSSLDYVNRLLKEITANP